MDSSAEESLGLMWARTTLSVEPRWTTDVDIESIRTEIRAVIGAKDCQIAFFAQGAFNKLYSIQTETEVFIMRITLPVDPSCKTASQVATTAWILHHTTLSVPEILAYKSSQDNAIGFEWILMTKLPGETLSSVWQSIDLNAKQAIVRRLVDFSSTLFENQRQGFGNLYLLDSFDLSGTPSSSRLGEIVSLEFLWANRLRFGTSRGPFQSSRDWFATRLSLLEKECRSTMTNPEIDEADLDDAERTLRIILKLQKCIDIIFPDEGNISEPSMLHHDDLSQHNVLSRPRETQPERGEYKCDEAGEPDELYWDHLLEYESTYLRRVFIDAMRHVQPDWVTTFEECTMERNFDYAVTNCDDVFLARDIEDWIETVVQTGIPSFDLRDRVQAY